MLLKVTIRNHITMQITVEVFVEFLEELVLHLQYLQLNFGRCYDAFQLCLDAV